MIDSPVSHLDIYPTLCEFAGTDEPEWLRGSSLMPLVRGEADALHEAIFAEVTYHAAYEPQRAVRTDRWKYIRRFDDYPHPVLANCDDGPSKDLLVAAGWGETVVAREQLFDLLFDPGEGENLAGDPGTNRCSRRCASASRRWMSETSDPLLDGPGRGPPTAPRSTARSGLPRGPAALSGPSSGSRSIQLTQVQPGVSASAGCHRSPARRR